VRRSHTDSVQFSLFLCLSLSHTHTHTHSDTVVLSTNATNQNCYIFISASKCLTKQTYSFFSVVPHSFARSNRCNLFLLYPRRINMSFCVTRVAMFAFGIRHSLHVYNGRFWVISCPSQGIVLLRKFVLPGFKAESNNSRLITAVSLFLWL
jgi:hypothetical protein